MAQIKVGMADLAVAKEPDTLITIGLGSCVGIALYDPLARVGGLAHIMLPDSSQVRNRENLAKFADTAIPLTIDKMTASGALKSRLNAKIAGGAQMFSFAGGGDLLKIGARNVAAVKEVLARYNIPILHEDTGGNFGRTIELITATGVLIIKTIDRGSKEV